MALRARAAFGSGLYLRDIHQEVVWASGLSLEAHLHSTFITSFETSKRILIFVPLYYNPDLDCFTSRQYLTSTLHRNPTQNLDFFNAGVVRYGVRSLAFLRLTPRRASAGPPWLCRRSPGERKLCDVYILGRERPFLFYIDCLIYYIFISSWCVQCDALSNVIAFCAHLISG